MAICDQHDGIYAGTGDSHNTRSHRSDASVQVGINCLQVDASYVGGLNTLLLGLLESFANADTRFRFRLFLNSANRHLFERFRKYNNFDLTVVCNRLYSVRSAICQAALLSRNSSMFKWVNDAVFRDVHEQIEADCDVLYTPTPTLRYFNGRKPSVLTMHDIQHLHYPEFFSWPKLLSRNITYDLSARSAHYLQANCEFTKRDFLSHFRWLSPEQIEVIPPGVSKEKFTERKSPELLRRRYSLPDRFLFYPAQLWPHKNHLTLLKALKQIERMQSLKIPLIMTGAQYSAAPMIFEFMEDQAMDYARYLGRVPDQDMVGLFQNAAFMITSTLHESSSIPILESAAAGTPVIASRIPPFEEFAEVLQLNLFDPLNIDGLARLILDLWRDDTTAASQAAYNREHVACYSWENAARKYLRLFERATHS